MPFILKKYPGIIGEKIQTYLVSKLSMNTKIAQRLIARGRVFDKNENAYKIGEIINSETILIAEFAGSTRGLKPLINTPKFAIFDKPTNLMVHPINKFTPYTLLDEVRYHFGDDANLVHRIDAETSGLIMCTKDRENEAILKSMFQDKKYSKSYITIARGKITKSLEINKEIDRENGMIGVRMKAGDGGKESHTIINPIAYNEKRDLSLVEAIPITGRQHQIRVHLHSIGHTIYGDPVYGVEDTLVDDYLNKKLPEDVRAEVTGSNRLWLHANYLEFTFEGATYKIYSKNMEIWEKFNSL